MSWYQSIHISTIIINQTCHLYIVKTSYDIEISCKELHWPREPKFMHIINVFKNYDQAHLKIFPQSVVTPKDINKMFGITASDIDKYSRVIFPITFICFQVILVSNIRKIYLYIYIIWTIIFYVDKTIFSADVLDNISASLGKLHSNFYLEHFDIMMFLTFILHLMIQIVHKKNCRTH